MNLYIWFGNVKPLAGKMEFLDLSTIITIAVAVFVLLRLRSVLGKRTGYQKPDDFMREMKTPPPANDDPQDLTDNVVKLPTRKKSAEAEEKNPYLEEINEIAKPRTKLNKGLKEVLEHDSTFSPKEFLSGAEMAYEMVVNAFADGDRKSLRNLLSDEVYESFSSVIADRESRDETVQFSFVGIDDANILASEMKGSSANITVKFISQMVSATFSKDGKLVDGDENTVASVKDIWTFARDTNSRNPNWELVATESEN